MRCDAPLPSLDGSNRVSEWVDARTHAFVPGRTFSEPQQVTVPGDAGNQMAILISTTSSLMHGRTYSPQLEL